MRVKDHTLAQGRSWQARRLDEETHGPGARPCIFPRLLHEAPTSRLKSRCRVFVVLHLSQVISQNRCRPFPPNATAGQAEHRKMIRYVDRRFGLAPKFRLCNYRREGEIPATYVVRARQQSEKMKLRWSNVQSSGRRQPATQWHRTDSWQWLGPGIFAGVSLDRHPSTMQSLLVGASWRIWRTSNGGASLVSVNAVLQTLLSRHG